MRALDSQGRGLADAEVTGTQYLILEPASPSGPRGCPLIPTMKDKLPTVKATLEWGLGGACMLTGSHGEAGLPLLPHPRTVAIQPAPSWRAGVCVCVNSPDWGRHWHLWDYSMAWCADQILQRLPSKGKQSRTQIPPLKTRAKQGKGGSGRRGSHLTRGLVLRRKGRPGQRRVHPAHLRACGCPSRLCTRMCVPICCTAHSHVLHCHMHL